MIRILPAQKAALEKALGSDPIKSCPAVGNLAITVMYGETDGPEEREELPTDEPFEGATVQIFGPVDSEGITGPDGTVEFESLPPGYYSIRVSYDTHNPVVDAARRRIDSELWKETVERGDYGEGTDKCNLFVYEMLEEGGAAPPMETMRNWKHPIGVDHPPLAGDWGHAAKVIEGWNVVPDPKPGDVAAEEAPPGTYAASVHASGHVGIVSYPQPGRDNPRGESVIAGQTRGVQLLLVRKTISQSSLANKVVENGWGFRRKQKRKPTFRRHAAP